MNMSVFNLGFIQFEMKIEQGQGLDSEPLLPSSWAKKKEWRWMDYVISLFLNIQ